MKNTPLIGSILEQTNQIISPGDSDWSHIRPGSLIKFKNDEVFYTVSRADKHLLVKDFTTTNSNNIKINTNAGTLFSIGDTLTISYKEWELLTVFSIIDGGIGYSVGDILFLNGGVPVTDIQNNVPIIASLIVSEISGGGKITKIKINNRGKYINVPEKSCLTNGGKGNGAKFQTEYKLLEQRGLMDRTILNIVFGDESILFLDYSIPDGVQDGKFSVEKWQITLSSSYSGTNKINESFTIVRDFSPNYGWPLLLKNSGSVDGIFNHVINEMDMKIHHLEQENLLLQKRLEKLEK